MAKRTAVVFLTTGALLALGGPGALAAQGGPGVLVAQDGPGVLVEGRAAWAGADGELAARGVSFGVTEPAVEEAGASFPAVGGGLDAERATAEVQLGGAVRLGGSPGQQPLVLAGLTLRLAGSGGTLLARTALDGRAREVTLASVAASGAGPVVRESAVTWAGLWAELSEEGAELLSSWSGRGFVAGDGLGVLDVTVGTGVAEEPVGAPAANPTPTAGSSAEASPEAAAAVSLARPTLPAGGQQGLTGEGFTPGAVLLVAIDGDTRYQVVAGGDGRFGQDFPVYENAARGAHAVEVTAVTGERAVLGAEFEVVGFTSH
ncbi:HtaA domain-containing protein [Streptomyces niveiscabiei]|uniref:HtaA domain-containing protein n=1 Tax=Streptomyces niveiscabiei TaxID=164115 RepID=UPI0029BA72E8|nr:HtaA domain-containing protein [Streptomyces niveiscabiei]MDX3384145.1 HtaA domain-containing protein [Streptomyces niveiscabiei]